jgi:hypothetical protein
MKNSRELIDSVVAADKKRFVESYRFMEEQQIKKALATAQWEDLKHEVENVCLEITQTSPATLEFEPASSQEVTVRNLKNGRTSTLRFDPTVPCVHYSTPKGNGHYAFKVNEGGGSIIFVVDGEIPIVIKELAWRVIKPLLGG